MEDQRLKTAGGFDLAAFVFMAAGKHAGHSSKMGCPQCGTSLAEVVTGGRMGCAGCYDRFAKEIEYALNSIHGASVHRGKTP